MSSFFNRIFGIEKNNKVGEMDYWTTGGGINEGDFALCSDNSCPCPEVKIPRGQGYIYVEQYPNGAFGGNLTCEQGAKLRKLDLEVARKDAIHWWATGMMPKRVTPKK